MNLEVRAGNGGRLFDLHKIVEIAIFNQRDEFTPGEMFGQLAALALRGCPPGKWAVVPRGPDVAPMIVRHADDARRYLQELLAFTFEFIDTLPADHWVRTFVDYTSAPAVEVAS